MVHDFVKKTDALNVDLRRFLVSPERWRSSRVAFPINWSYVDFNEANKENIPKEAGIYAFIVSHKNNHFPQHGFIMYIGITGRTLRQRYGEYLKEQKTVKRPKVSYMLEKYSQDLQFAFSPIDHAIDLGALELDLNDAIIPPVVVKDFTAEIKQLVNAMAAI